MFHGRRTDENVSGINVIMREKRQWKKEEDNRLTEAGKGTRKKKKKKVAGKLPG